MRLLNTAIMRLTIMLMLGIAAGFYITPSLELVFSITASLSLLFIFMFLRARHLLLQDSLFGFVALMLFFGLGMLTAWIHSPENQPQHYSNLLQPGNSRLHLSINEHLKPNLYNEQYIATVRTMEGKQSHGKLLLKLPKGSSQFLAGDEIYLSTPLRAIPKPLNPQRFDYQEFMANRGVLHQASVEESEVLHLASTNKSLQTTAENIRSKIYEDIGQKTLAPEELAVFQALLLGQRKNLSEAVEEQYASAGVIHILAVSGLHVGILLLLFNWLLSPLENLSTGRLIKTLIILGLLWSYALLAGLSPSILRAVTMFSFIAIALQLKRKNSVLNSIFFSLLLLLLIRPQLLFEVGFQLSYTAVLAIVLFQPYFYSIWRSSFPPADYLWKIFTVSLAAQLGVLPLSIYYFHQFPGLFFLSNLVILPFMGLLLGLGILLIGLSLLNMLPDLLGGFYASLISYLNSFVGWVAQQESMVFRDLPFSEIQVMVVYILLAVFYLFLQKKNTFRLKVLLLTIIMVQGVWIYEATGSSSEELIVFHKIGNTMVGQQRKGHLKLTHNLKEDPESLALIRNYRLQNRIKNINAENIRHVYFSSERYLLVVDSSGIYRLSGKRPEYILLVNSPGVNLERLICDLQPREVIADGSNYKNFVMRWKETCERTGVLFHYTGEIGAWRQRAQSAQSGRSGRDKNKIPFQ